MCDRIVLNTKKLLFQEYEANKMIHRSREFFLELSSRRTVRNFTPRAVPEEVIENALKTAVSAPSGANRQPWRFVMVRDQATKRKIRVGAEAEEREFYQHRATKEWLEAIAPLGTDENKPFLTEAPVLIVVFLERFGVDNHGKKIKNYYMPESVGLACGFLIAALHHAGLATLTHTPSPMGFLNEILDRPSREKPFLLLVVGYPTPHARIPDISRLPFATTIIDWDQRRN